ncbi:MAG TPA: hypothetical protein VIT68_00105 [Candidatus Gracilibacteria bacterium]
MKKFIALSALVVAPFVFGSQANAFWGGGFDEDRFTEMKTMFSQHSTFESFKSAMEAKRAERKAAFDNMTDEEKAAMKAKRGGRGGKGGFGKGHGFGENVERTTENIANGVIITLTSDDADVIEKLQTRGAHKGGRGFGGGRRGGRGRGGWGGQASQ